MSAITPRPARRTDDRKKRALAIGRLLNHVEALANERGLNEVAFLIGVASEAAMEVAAVAALERGRERAAPRTEAPDSN